MRDFNSFCFHHECDHEGNVVNSCGKLREDCKEHINDIANLESSSIQLYVFYDFLKKLNYIKGRTLRTEYFKNFYKFLLNNPMMCHINSGNPEKDKKFIFTLIYCLDKNINELKFNSFDIYNMFISFKNKFFEIHKIDMQDICEYYTFLNTKDNINTEIDTEMLNDYKSIYDHYNVSYKLKFID